MKINFYTLFIISVSLLFTGCGRTGKYIQQFLNQESNNDSEFIDEEIADLKAKSVYKYEIPQDFDDEYLTYTFVLQDDNKGILNIMNGDGFNSRKATLTFTYSIEGTKTNLKFPDVEVVDSLLGFLCNYPLYIIEDSLVYSNQNSTTFHLSENGGYSIEDDPEEDQFWVSVSERMQPSPNAREYSYFPELTTDVWVDMGVLSDDGSPLYWAKGDLVYRQDGTFGIAAEGQLANSFVWGNNDGRLQSDCNESLCGGINPQQVISGDSLYDVVTHELGYPCRMPTHTEIERLIEGTTQRFGSFPIELPKYLPNGLPSSLLGQWMIEYLPNDGLHQSRSILIDGLLANDMVSVGGRNAVEYAGPYNLNGQNIYIGENCYTFDASGQVLYDSSGRLLRHISKKTSFGESYGCLLTSNENNNTIFLPCSAPQTTVSNGDMVMTFKSSQLYHCWAGSYNKEHEIAYMLLMSYRERGIGLAGDKRNNGASIRPVTTEPIGVTVNCY